MKSITLVKFYGKEYLQKYITIKIKFIILYVNSTPSQNVQSELRQRLPHRTTLKRYTEISKPLTETYSIINPDIPKTFIKNSSKYRAAFTFRDESIRRSGARLGRKATDRAVGKKCIYIFRGFSDYNSLKSSRRGKVPTRCEPLRQKWKASKFPLCK